MVVDRFPGIVRIVLLPYQFHEHFIGEHSLGVQYEQSKISNSLTVSGITWSRTVTRRCSKQKYKSPSRISVNG